MRRSQYNQITAWQDKTFPNATPLSCAEHLKEEVEELRNAIFHEHGNDAIDEEIADCFLLLIGVCNKTGMVYDNIVKIIDAKMEINYKRQWGKVNEKGYVKHI